MRTLIHLSDLHFGRTDETVIESLLRTVHELAPDVVAVSGDFTQRARPEQFREAQAFLRALPSPQIVVPGNHDIPLYNVFRRFFRALTRYTHYISDDLTPFYGDEEIAVLGINTARSFTLKDGRINTRQIAHIRECLCTDRPNMTRILVTHHPFELPPGHAGKDIVGRARLVMETLATCKVDLLLAGHLHRSYTAYTIERYRIRGYSALVVQAGTATSTRSRGEANAFNLIKITAASITVVCFLWQPTDRAFVPSAARHFRLTNEGWMGASEVPVVDLPDLLTPS